MPFVRVELAGTATREQRSAIVADITRSLVDHLGKNPAAVQIVIAEHATDHYGAGGVLIADREAARPASGTSSSGEVARANGTR